MIGFVEYLGSGGMVPISAIKCVGDARRNEHGVELRDVEMVNGKRFDILEHEVSELRLRPAQIIPALQGVKLLHVIVDDAHLDEIWDEPVIAWALCLDGEVRPVTPNGVIGGMSFWDDHYVEVPGGRIQAVGQFSTPACFDDRDEMLRHYVAIEQAKKNVPGEFVSELDPDSFGQKPVGQSELERLIADYVATGNALNATAGQGLPDDNPIERAYLAATTALDDYVPRTPAEFVRALSARFHEDGVPTGERLKELLKIAHRLSTEVAA